MGKGLVLGEILAQKAKGLSLGVAIDLANDNNKKKK